MRRAAPLHGGRAELLGVIGDIPAGRVASYDGIARHLDMSPALVRLLLERLSEDERQMVPWHRVVAKGGGIGRGLHRDQQFARLVREGLTVSPAGVVQDLDRVMITDHSLKAVTAPEPAPTAGGRSRGMKSRP